MSWECDKCPWNEKHKCAVKNISICKYFREVLVDKDKGILDTVLCGYSKNNS